MAYRLSADSLIAKDIYGVENAQFEFEFKTKAAEDMSTLKLKINGLDPDIPSFVELMASGDKPKYSAPVINGVAMFDGIDAGKYYARLYEDFDGNGKYTPGSYRLQKIFGEAIDSLINVTPIAIQDSIMANDSIPIDSLENIAESSGMQQLSAASLNMPTDSIAMSIDSLALSTDSLGALSAAGLPRFVRPMSDKEIVDSLKRVGYSLLPIETDSIGNEVLIAIQPDLVYYYPKILNVKKNWDVEQEWNVFETALDLQKPSKIKKNKPKNNKNRQQKEEEEEEEEDEFGANPFAPNRNSNNRNRSGGNY